MSKRQVFGKMVEPTIWRALSETYGVSISNYTDKQRQLLTGIVDGLYDIFGNKMTVKDMEEILGEKYEAVANSIQKD